MKNTRKNFVVCKKKVFLQKNWRVKSIQNLKQTKDPLSNKQPGQDLRLYPHDKDEKKKTCKM
jgi:hypothetical protein